MPAGGSPGQDRSLNIFGMALALIAAAFTGAAAGKLWHSTIGAEPETRISKEAELIADQEASIEEAGAEEADADAAD
ncbi:hypothetical protein [Altericroceibacterium xinjiangense]|uniref:hypothetical protein n=1 Tax=Altericroceibacterium xinjiangense TaxID=762261 RepID=UPI000F7D600B|nr:hypothetical protein [Altericroceibacterium xinjiangense]